MAMTDDELIAREIEDDWYHPGPADVRLRRSGVHVWAIIGFYLGAGGLDKATVAQDYEIPVEEIEACLAYYRRHRAEIDARLAANSPALVG
ncbi:MAG TPA: hypothetical protein VNL16_10015 [Chloroflexota bacterium]|nr:hypothetical protein [Chloroflexota bacterium]